MDDCVAGPPFPFSTLMTQYRIVQLSGTGTYGVF